MTRGSLDAVLAGGIAAVCVGVAGFLVWHVDNSPSSTEHRACAIVVDARASVDANAPFLAARRTIGRLAAAAGAAEDTALRHSGTDARTRMRIYHAVLVRAGFRSAQVDALPVRSAADEVPAAMPVLERVTRDLIDVQGACARIARRR